MPVLPTFVQIEPVGQCNLRCQMCAIQFRMDGPPHGPPAFMPFETFTGLLDGFGAIEDLHLQGLGEPMMHPRFFDMIAYATARGIRVTTNSNLTLLNARRAERCVQSGLDCLHISIDGAQAAPTSAYACAPTSSASYATSSCCSTHASDWAAFAHTSSSLW